MAVEPTKVVTPKPTKVSLRTSTGGRMVHPVTGDAFDSEASKPVALDSWTEFQLSEGRLTVVEE